MSSTTIINIKGVDVARLGDRYVYVGRPSKWGNPFYIGGRGNFRYTRDTAIAKYEMWIRAQPELLAALPELVGKTLGCFCRPLACHGDVLIKLMVERGLLDGE